MNSHTTLLTADEAVHDLTLALLYLQRVSNNSTNPTNNLDSEAPNPAYRYWDVTGFKSSTSYDSEVLGWLQEVGYVSNYKRPYTASSASSAESQHLIVTKAGVLRAREILTKLGIQDWDKAEILKESEV